MIPSRFVTLSYEENKETKNIEEYYLVENGASNYTDAVYQLMLMIGSKNVKQKGANRNNFFLDLSTKNKRSNNQ